MTEIVHIPFHGTRIYTVQTKAGPHVVLRPTIEGMGLNFWAQLKKLGSRSWATVCQTETVAEDGKVREMATIDIEAWAMLLANIDENRVAQHCRELVVWYQRESARVLRDYWTTGTAVRAEPRLPKPRQPIGFGSNLPQPDVFTFDEVCGLLRQHCGLDLTVNELTRNLRAGGVLKQNGSPTKKHRHLLWFTGNAWNVVAHMFPQLVYKVCETGRDMQDWRFLQMRLELEGVGQPPKIPVPRRPAPSEATERVIRD